LTRLKSPRRRLAAIFLGSGWFALFLIGPLAHGQTETLAPLIVSATRTEQTPDQIPVTTVTLTAEDLAAYPTVTLDDALRDDPSFSLFRRTSSLISNPTSQGVSLRGIGPSGASRSLVLLDGVPLNDPFGGWVVWSEVPRLSLADVEIEHGGGSGVWGDSALAGSISLTDEPPKNGGSVDAEVGAFDTYSLEADVGMAGGRTGVSVDARDFSTDGFYNLAPNTRGLVDRPLRSDHRLAQASVEESVGKVQVVATGRVFDEARGNGTVLQNNTTHQAFGSLAVSGSNGSDFDWNAIGYAERESFSSFFSSVSANRSTETPANNQFDVPATAVGGALTAHWSSPGVSTSVGADVRQVEGETREDITFSNGAFTGIRFAGGAQDFAGLFVHQDRELVPGLRISADLRGDDWENRNGHDREYSLVTHAPTLLAAYPKHTGGELSPNLGFIWQPAQGWSLRAAVYRGFRLPTLNEYYRPFRVGTVTTTANPNLVTEDLYGAEAGAAYDAGSFHFQTTAFADELYHAVGTVTLSQTATSTTVQRQNLDAVRTRGFEAAAKWQATPSLGFRVGYLYDDSRVTAAGEEPNLVGQRLPEVPRGTATAAVDDALAFGVQGEARLRWVSLQFDDEQNTLRLPAATVVDFELSRKFGRAVKVFLALENALNAQVATSLSTAGLFTYDAPRMLRAGVRVDW
jgi:outer membrane receptor protein involved in Fe transport